MSNLLARVEAKSAERRQAAAAKYRELLGRFERPAAGDETELADVMAVLGVTVDDLSEHASLVRRIGECERLSGNVESLQDDLVGKHQALADALRETEQAREDLEKSIAGKVEPLQAARAAAEASLNDAKHARGELPLLGDEWAGLVQARDVEQVRRARLAAEAAARGYAIHGPGPRRQVVRAPELESSL